MSENGSSAQSQMDNGGVDLRVEVLKAADPSYGKIIDSIPLEIEDEFKTLYVGKANPTGDILAPPYDKKTLAKLVTENNTLDSCINAMIVNIDGSGYDIEIDPEGDIEESEKATQESEKKAIKDAHAFFREPFPFTSLMKIRKQIRRDIEAIGEGYIEVVRNKAGKIVLLRRLDSTMMRLAKLDEAVPLSRKLNRGGAETKVQYMGRERRYAQMSSNGKVLYFKEYGSQRKLHKLKGFWESDKDKKQVVKPEMEATEVIHIKCQDDLLSPYGIPRWIPQTPSVLGSRKAEVFNLDFFDNGGIPPILIFALGGMFGQDARKRLEQILSGTAKEKNRGAVVDVNPTGGSLDKAASASVKVERFGAERQQDSMFEKYDGKCEERIRKAFRLPPLFLGKAEDYTFATAYASYVVAEAQVFGPERKDFDETLNVTIMKELFNGLVFKSKPITVKDIEQQLAALGMVKDKMDGEDVIDAANNIAGTRFKYSKEAEEKNSEANGNTSDDGGLDGEGETADGMMTADGGRDSNNVGKEKDGSGSVTNLDSSKTTGSGSKSKSKKDDDEAA